MHDEQLTDLERLTLSRRRFIGAGALAGAALFLGGGLLGRSALAQAVSAASPLMGFANIAASSADTISLPPGYSFSSLISWGQPLHTGGPAFKGDGSNSAAEQLLQFGDNTDGMSLFPWPGDADRALMAINNEYVNYRYLLAHGGLPKSAEDVRKAQSAEGVTVIEVRRQNGAWSFVQGSPYNRRVHGNIPIEVSGPARGHALLKTQADPAGVEGLGTFQNCSSGQTPWGTYLTCEENFSDCFGSTDANLAFTADQKRFSVLHASAENEWHRFDPRFDIARNPNELNRHGWIVEIDPFDPSPSRSNVLRWAVSSMRMRR